MASQNIYFPLKWEADSRSSTGLTRKVFPFGETYQEIAKSGGESVETLELAPRANPLFHRWFEQMRASGLYSEELLQKGDASPLGIVQAAVIDAATPALVGRQISSLIRVDDIQLRLYRRKPAFAKKTASGSRAGVLGGRYDKVDIPVDTILEE